MLVNYANGTLNLFSLKTKTSQLNFKFNEQVTSLSFDPSESGLFCLGFNDGTIGIYNKNKVDPNNIVFASRDPGKATPIKKLIWTQHGIVVLGGHTDNEKPGIRLIKGSQFKDSIFIEAIPADFISLKKNSDQLSFWACSNDRILFYADDNPTANYYEHLFNPYSLNCLKLIAPANISESKKLKKWMITMNPQIKEGENPSMLITCHASLIHFWDCSSQSSLVHIHNLILPKEELEVLVLEYCISSRTLCVGCHSGDVFVYTFKDEFELVFTMPMHVEPISLLKYSSSENKLAIADCGNVLSLSDTISGECILYEAALSNIESLIITQIESADCHSDSFAGYSLKGAPLWNFSLDTPVSFLFMLDMSGSNLKIPAKSKNSFIAAAELASQEITGPIERNEDGNNEVVPIVVTDKVSLVITETSEEFDIPDLGYIGPRYLLVVSKRSIIIFDSEPPSKKADSTLENDEIIDKKFNLIFKFDIKANIVKAKIISSALFPKFNAASGNALVLILANFELVILSLFDFATLFSCNLSMLTILDSVVIGDDGQIFFRFSDGLLQRAILFDVLSEMQPLVDEHAAKSENIINAPKRKTVFESIFGSSDVELEESFSKAMSEHLTPGKVWTNAQITPEEELKDRIAAHKAKKAIQQSQPKSASAGISETSIVMENNLNQARSNLQKTNEVADKSSEMAAQAQNFAAIAKQLRKQNESWF